MNMTTSCRGRFTRLEPHAGLLFTAVLSASVCSKSRHGSRGQESSDSPAPPTPTSDSSSREVESEVMEMNADLDRGFQFSREEGDVHRLNLHLWQRQWCHNSICPTKFFIMKKINMYSTSPPNGQDLDTLVFPALLERPRPGQLHHL